MSIEQKALKAVRDYARLTGEIRRLKNVIGESLSKCNGVNGYLQPPPFDAILDDATWRKHNQDTTHLKAAYTPEPACDTYEQYLEYMAEEDLREFLSECPHCMAAHEAIQARKAARRSLAATKRFIGRLGREAM
jgi:hypothetical protein